MLVITSTLLNTVGISAYISMFQKISGITKYKVLQNRLAQKFPLNLQIMEKKLREGNTKTLNKVENTL